MAWRLPALKAEAKTVKAMKTPAAKAKGMKPDTKTMKATKTPAAKAKGMKLKTKTKKAMKTPAAEENMKARRASAAKVDAERSVGTDWGVAAIEVRRHIPLARAPLVITAPSTLAHIARDGWQEQQAGRVQDHRW